MPYVDLAPVGPEARLAAAERRWMALAEVRPDLDAAVALQRELLAVVAEASDTLERAPLPRLSLPPRYLAVKLTRGVPVLSGEPIPVPEPLLTPALLRLCDALARGGAGEAAEHIRTTLANRQIDPASLLTASLGRDQRAIRTAAVHNGLAPDLLWLVAELAISPFAHLLQRTLLFAAPDRPPLQTALDGWCHGFCPACGSWPALAEAVVGRTLRCSFCAAAWELPSFDCIYCHESNEAFIVAALDEERRDRRLELCERCQGYLKNVAVAALSPFPLLAIADLESMDLDLAAMQRGFSRPPLKEFGRPSASASRH